MLAFNASSICTLLVKGIVRVVLHAEGLLAGIADGQLKIQLNGSAAKICMADLIRRRARLRCHRFQRISRLHQIFRCFLNTYHHALQLFYQFIHG